MGKKKSVHKIRAGEAQHHTAVGSVALAWRSLTPCTFPHAPTQVQQWKHWKASCLGQALRRWPSQTIWPRKERVRSGSSLNRAQSGSGLEVHGHAHLTRMCGRWLSGKDHVWITHVAALHRKVTAPNWDWTACHTRDKSSDEGGRVRENKVFPAACFPSSLGRSGQTVGNHCCRGAGAPLLACFGVGLTPSCECLLVWKVGSSHTHS